MPSLFRHGALYRFFLVLRKLLLVSYCVVVWVLFGVFLCFCIMSLVIAPIPNTKRLPIIKCGTSHRQPPKMQFSGCLWEIVTHGNQTTRGLFRERSQHIFFLEENLLHSISKLWYVWFQFVNENSLYTFSGIVHSMSKEQVRGNFDRPCVKWLITRS